MKKIFFIAFSFFLFYHPVFADDATSTPIFNIEVSVDVPANCVATDTDAVIHTYEASSSGPYLGICALEAAIASSSVSSAELSNQYPELGLFVTALAGVSADPSSQYWALYKNGDFASVGLAILPVSLGDTITLQLHDFSDNDLGYKVTLDISSLTASSSEDVSTSTTDTNVSAGDTAQDTESDNTQSNSGGGGLVHKNIDVNAALNFLEANEKQDGSFGSNMYTDWAAMAFAVGPENSYKDKITNYEKSAPDNFTSATDFERHAMALESLGINPYTGTDTNYIQKIISEFDGTQIGDPSLTNDDIFSIFPLVKAGYSSSDNIIKKVVADIVSKQNSDGSWVGGVDMTAAAIQALEMTSSLPNVYQAISKARTYLVSEERSDGGFGSSDATSWAIQSIFALGESPTNWISGGNNPYDYLSSLEQSDGGIGAISEDTNTRIWATAYAIPAALGKPWAAILNSFPRPAAAMVVAAAGAANISLPSATSTSVFVSATSSVATISLSTKASLGAEKAVIGSLVRFAPTTRSPITAFSASTSNISQSAAVVATQNSGEISFIMAVTEKISSILVLGGICLFVII